MGKIDLQDILKDLHTTILGKERIKRNLELNCDDIVLFCKEKIKNSKIFEKGKNFYCETEKFVFVINKTSKTIITAHKRK